MSKMNAAFKEVDGATFVALDVETTGLSPWWGHRICEIALVVWKEGSIIEKFHSLINPGCPLSPGASQVNGITCEMVEHAPVFSELMPDIRRVLDQKILVCHNAPFDLNFLQFQLKDLEEQAIDNPVIDTLVLARRHYTFPSNKLGAIARFLNMPLQQEHRALGDAILTKQLCEHFLTDLRDKREYSIETVIEYYARSFMRRFEDEESDNNVTF